MYFFRQFNIKYIHVQNHQLCKHVKPDRTRNAAPTKYIYIQDNIFTQITCILKQLSKCILDAISHHPDRDREVRQLICATERNTHTHSKTAIMAIARLWNVFSIIKRRKTQVDTYVYLQQKAHTHHIIQFKLHTPYEYIESSSNGGPRKYLQLPKHYCHVETKDSKRDSNICIIFLASHYSYYSNFYRSFLKGYFIFFS